MQYSKITKQNVAKASDEELRNVHRRLHSWWANLSCERDMSKETDKMSCRGILDRHLLVVKEFGRRGIKHNEVDALDTMTNRVLRKEQEADEAGRCGTGQGAGKPKKGDGGVEYCVCPNCGYKMKHERGTPCNQVKCPECGTPMQGAEEAKKVDYGKLKGKCPYAGDEEKCPAAEKGYGYPPKKGEGPPEAAKKCKYAKEYKCPYFGTYYYPPKNKDEDLDVPPELNDLARALLKAGTYEECEAIAIQAQQLEIPEEFEDFRELIIAEAEEKADIYKADNRVELSDSFEGQVMELTEAEEGRVKFKAIVGQVNKVNKNNRLYPKKEIVKNLPRVNELIKAGKFVGLADHPSLFSSGSVLDIAVKFTAVGLKGNNIVAEGEVIPTQAGQEIVTLWKHGVNTEWSLRGYGELRPAKDKDGKDLGYDIVENYVWDAIDIVLRGAAETQTLKVEFEHEDHTEDETIQEEMSRSEDSGGEAMANEKDRVQEQVEEQAQQEPATENQDTQPAPEFNVDELVKQIEEKVASKAAEITQAALAAAELAAYKRQRVEAELADLDEATRKPIIEAVERAKSKEEVDKVFEEFKPLVEKVLLAKKVESYGGVGIITEERRKKHYSEMWVHPATGDIVERPETVAEVKAALLEGLEGYQRKVFEQILQNYEEHYPQYFEACTKQRVMEAATTTTALGVTLPQVLPLTRQFFPDLIPSEIASVQPLKAPTGRVYHLAFKTSGGADLADSSAFDSTWADHEEGATKSQITLEFTSTDIEAEEKAIYFHVSEELIQDMKALYNLDAERELLQAASDEIAREVNYQFLELLRTNASGASETYGTQRPSGYTSDLEWYRMLVAYIQKVSGEIGSKVNHPGNWIVGDPQAINILSAIDALQGGQPERNYGTGIARVGVVRGFTVYEAQWFQRNTILVGFKPPSWQYAGAVYAPYVPIYIGQTEIEAATNTRKRSVSSRAAMAVLNGNAYGVITITNSTGVAPF